MKDKAAAGLTRSGCVEHKPKCSLRMWLVPKCTEIWWPTKMWPRSATSPLSLSPSPLPHNYSQLPHYYLTATSPLPHITSPLPYNYSPLPHHYLTATSPLPHRYLTFASHLHARPVRPHCCLAVTSCDCLSSQPPISTAQLTHTRLM